DEIEIWSDHSSMEIFINGGKMVFSARIFPQCRQPEIITKGNLPKEKIQICDISIPEKEEE
ncbi:MAG: GH32 C-terminal domain-containing protein, partial [Lachnospiraceae bacterium]|nr:GH32 C-terminal domain-containing protein [Lachnospiraceae bacterium]